MSEHETDHSSLHVPEGLVGPPHRKQNYVIVQVAQNRCLSTVPYLPPAELERLQFGYLAYVYVLQPNGPPLQLRLPNEKFPIRALCAFSPGIQAACYNNAHADIDHVILPGGRLRGYTALFTWLEHQIYYGVDHYPQTLSEVELMRGAALRLGATWSALEEHHDFMLRHAWKTRFCIKDVSILFHKRMSSRNRFIEHVVSAVLDGGLDEDVLQKINQCRKGIRGFGKIYKDEMKAQKQMRKSRESGSDSDRSSRL